MKHQLRSLEKRIIDLKLVETEPIRQNEDEEELYEAGIAEDMRVLEQRWECELAEQERRWSESDPKT